MTDQSSNPECSWGSISEPLVKNEPESPPAEEPHEPPKTTWREHFSRIVCIICGRIGKFVAAFVHRE